MLREHPDLRGLKEYKVNKDKMAIKDQRDQRDQLA
jgi:hypothetical protein